MSFEKQNLATEFTENTERDEVLPVSVTHSKSDSNFHKCHLFFRVWQKRSARVFISNLSVNSVFSVANCCFR
jgi:hypothetical protein